jgi:tRNA pseudouridine38-40 synthase
MQEAIPYFLGKHDFTAFKASGSEIKSTERTILSTSLEKKGDILEFEITGDGFLYNMVRIIVGTLIDVGMGRITSNDILSIIESKDRRRAGRTAPAHGLYLVEVFYSN